MSSYSVCPSKLSYVTLEMIFPNGYFMYFDDPWFTVVLVSNKALSSNSGGGHSNIFCFHPDPSEMIQFDLRKLFNWVETTNIGSLKVGERI